MPLLGAELDVRNHDTQLPHSPAALRKRVFSITSLNSSLIFSLHLRIKNAVRSTEIAQVTSFPPVQLGYLTFLEETCAIRLFSCETRETTLFCAREQNELLTAACWRGLWSPAWGLQWCYHYFLDPGPDYSAPVDATQLKLVLQVSLESCPEEHRGKGEYVLK